MNEIHSFIHTLGVRIDNSFPLEIWAQGRDPNPDPEFPWAASPKDQGAACTCFPEVKPMQAEANNDGPDDEVSQIKGIIAPNKEIIQVPNEGNEILIISFMSLKATPVANQEPPPGEGTGPQPGPMNTTLEKDN
ncbi:hypothetical protein DSO57_1037761 [Entomophthora muscae]|uniref:Uncharacterized protein n=1 Tax=Entomophthora muscae TaxID=34485 RepID=A0ACC2SZQ4_9FUNG|nr:hypothetical protein DSO57_1037761 [Entomophthora muscae]